MNWSGTSKRLHVNRNCTSQSPVIVITNLNFCTETYIHVNFNVWVGYFNSLLPYLETMSLACSVYVLLILYLIMVVIAELNFENGGFMYLLKKLHF